MLHRQERDSDDGERTDADKDVEHEVVVPRAALVEEATGHELLGVTGTAARLALAVVNIPRVTPSRTAVFMGEVAGVVHHGSRLHIGEADVALAAMGLFLKHIVARRALERLVFGKSVFRALVFETWSLGVGLRGANPHVRGLPRLGEMLSWPW